MRIKQITSQHRNDFSADMECEHCGQIERLTTGYNDNFYHERVIPSMYCKSCGKNRAVETERAKDAEAAEECERRLYEANN